MLRILFVLCWLSTSSVMLVERARPVFGVKVSIGPNSQITSFVCYLDNGTFLTQKKIVDKESFVKIVSGYWPSVYNPDRVNFFEQNGIDCSVAMDSLTRKVAVGCLPLDSLWKIRFATYPFTGSAELGWSNKYHKPSPGQEIYLFERYGISQIDGDYFLGPKFWLLLKDVGDPQWIMNYKSIR